MWKEKQNCLPDENVGYNVIKAEIQHLRADVLQEWLYSWSASCSQCASYMDAQAAITA